MTRPPAAHAARVSVRLEVCVDTAAGLGAALRGGADRIELCAALALSGLTPTPGLMARAARAGQPVYAMIRPRAGDFVYDADELDDMRRDIDAVRAAGLAGVVLGASHRSGELDAEALARLRRHAEGVGATLHRAIDLTPDLEAALELAIELGFERVLTSGGAATAVEGAETIAALQARAAGRIAIMAGSGVAAGNVAALVAATGVGEVHASCSAPASALDAHAERLGFGGVARRETREANVAALVAALTA